MPWTQPLAFQTTLGVALIAAVAAFLSIRLQRFRLVDSGIADKREVKVDEDQVASVSSTVESPTVDDNTAETAAGDGCDRGSVHIDRCWQSLAKAVEQVQLAIAQVENATGERGFLPTVTTGAWSGVHRPVQLRSPDGRLVDARPLFRLQRQLGELVEQAKIESWRIGREALIQHLHEELDTMSTPSIRSITFCMAIARSTNVASQNLGLLLPELGARFLGPFLGLDLPRAKISPLIVDTQATMRLRLAVENLLVGDPDDDEFYHSQKWAMVSMGG